MSSGKDFVLDYSAKITDLLFNDRDRFEAFLLSKGYSSIYIDTVPFFDLASCIAESAEDVAALYQRIQCKSSKVSVTEEDFFSILEHNLASRGIIV